MQCEKCKGETRVFCCRNVNNRKYRKRKCLSCGNKTITKEVYVEKLPVGYGATKAATKAATKKPAKKGVKKNKVEKYTNDVKLKINRNSPEWLVKLAAKLNQ